MFERGLVLSVTVTDYEVASAVLLGGLLVVAGILKLRWPHDVEKLLQSLLPVALQRLGIRRLSRTVSGVEIVLGIAVATLNNGIVGIGSGLAAVLSFAGFTGVAMLAVRMQLPCGCFGQLSFGSAKSRVASAPDVRRNAILTAIAMSLVLVRTGAIRHDHVASFLGVASVLIGLSLLVALVTIVRRWWSRPPSTPQTTGAVGHVLTGPSSADTHARIPQRAEHGLATAPAPSLTTRRRFLRNISGAALVALGATIGLPFSRKTAFASYFFLASPNWAGCDPYSWCLYWANYDARLPDGLPISFDFRDGTGGTWYASNRQVAVYKQYASEGDRLWTAWQPNYGLQDWSWAYIFAQTSIKCRAALKLCQRCCQFSMACILCCADCFQRCSAGGGCIDRSCYGCWTQPV